MRALFVNVGQGDCTLVQHDGYSILCDGGTEGAIVPHLGRLRIEAPRLDLIVGTHYDADHLAGLTQVVEKYPEGSIGRVWLPPFLNPDGELVEGSPFLADRIWRDGLGSAISPLEAIARSLPDEELAELRRMVGKPRSIARNLDDRHDDLPAPGLDELFLGEHELVPSGEDEQDGASWEQLTRAESVARIEEAIGVVEELKLKALVGLMRVGLEINALAVAMPNVAASLMESPSVVGSRALAVTMATVAAVNGVHLEKLLAALRRASVQWEVPRAPDRAGWQSFGAFEIAHLSPTTAFVEANRRRLPVINKLLFAEMACRVDAELPSWANRLSHALAIRPRRRCRRVDCHCGVLLTGDCAFWSSVSLGADRIVGECGLIDIAHHGGRWGDFSKLLTDSRGSAGPWPLWLWLSTRPDGWNPPCERVARLVQALSQHAPTRLIAANSPDSRALSGLSQVSPLTTSPATVELRVGTPYPRYCPWYMSGGSAFCWEAAAPMPLAQGT